MLLHDFALFPLSLKPILIFATIIYVLSGLAFKNLILFARLTNYGRLRLVAFFSSTLLAQQKRSELRQGRKKSFNFKAEHTDSI